MALGTTNPARKCQLSQTVIVAQYLQLHLTIASGLEFIVQHLYKQMQRDLLRFDFDSEVCMNLHW